MLEGVYHLAMPEDMGEYMPNLTASMAMMENVSPWDSSICYAFVSLW